MLNLLFSNPFAFILIFGGLIISIGLHEASHAFMADYLGDPTPRSLGRTTLNPLAHLDPLGTLAILVTGFFGWGKPAPYDPYNLRDVRRDTALIALSGPAMNIVIAIILSIILHLMPLPSSINSIIIGTRLYPGLLPLNLVLALFNLIPIPPLDGSKIIGLFLSHESALRYQSQNNPILLLLLILPIFGGASIAYLLISPILNFLLNFLV